MKRTTLLGMAMAAIAAASIGLASAQTNGPSGVSVRVGLFMPSNSLASDLGSTWFGFGVDYKLNAMSASTPITSRDAYFGLSADYYSHGSDNDVPVALTYNMRQGQMVWSAGIGPDFRNSGDLTSTGIGLGEQVAFTYEFGSSPTPIFVQAKYFFSSKPELSGFGVFLGARF